MSENDDIAERKGIEREAEMKNKQNHEKKMYKRKYMREYMREYTAETRSYKRGPYNVKPKIKEIL